jgi:hypothetical protein
MVQQHDRAGVQVLRLSNRNFQRLRPVHELRPALPRHVEQLVAVSARELRVGIGHDHRRDAGVGDVGVRKTHEERGRKRALAFHLARAVLDLVVRRIEARLAHHVRQHRSMSEYQGRPRFAS